MKEKKSNARKLIVDTLTEKAAIKQKVYQNTVETLNTFKEILQETVNDLNTGIKISKNPINLEYKDRGAFEAEIKIAGDLLIFNMHTNIFEFDKGHGVWKTPYVQNNVMASYCGIINVYNFLADSFKYERMDDLGYLIARIFINKDKHYFVEGKRQLGFLYNDFANAIIEREHIKNIVDSAILYSLDFDLLVPPYENVSITSVAQMKEKINKSKIQTGKRLGFKFYADGDTV
ncbi:MAG: hypothetical protein A2W91_15630 [Bacteroidetes bacterium GWF2_38_335]|nr:MAG: hypothetical protein A2W91_15630 [Bacteroidetes bacterium GWF2_38_335]OFY81523.1 MAG: hypothetical protein A2281_11490 [Bacteroidetes bacterium RIFOXYA12_FULL_38_20]HBS87693.1 hypothetical protein [Bacteroidales bacterium]